MGCLLVPLSFVLMLSGHDTIAFAIMFAMWLRAV